MKSNPESERLLNDLLHNVAPEEFRAAVLHASLRHARWRRCRRGAAKGLSFAVVLFGLAWWSWSVRTPETVRNGPEPRAPAYGVVQTQLLDARLVVVTHRGLSAVVETESGMIAIVETSSEKQLYKEINDDELLLLLAGHPAGLSRQGPGQAAVLVLEPPDGDGAGIQ